MRSAAKRKRKSLEQDEIPAVPRTSAIMIEITSHPRETKLGRLIAEVRRGTRRRSGEKPGASTWNAVIYRPNACTDLLSQELTPGRDPELLAADERWRVSVNVGSTRCANYYQPREIKPNFLRRVPMIQPGRIVRERRGSSWKRKRSRFRSLTFSSSRRDYSEIARKP